MAAMSHTALDVPRPARLICQLDDPVAPARAIEASHALLEAAAASDIETVRLFRVSSCVAFGPRDERAADFEHAVELAQSAGFEAVPRVEGGRAVAADPDTLCIAWTIPDRDGRSRIRPRFSLLAATVAEALRALGVDAEVGAIPGEYCPGDFSIGVGARLKLVGLGQRVTTGAVHLGAFIVVDGSPRLREVLTAVNGALGVEWDPRSLGSVADVLGPPPSMAAVGERIIEAFRGHLRFVDFAADRDVA